MDVLKEYDYSIHESMFPMLILHAGTSIERMNCANYISMEEEIRELEDTIEYQISREFFDRISKRLHIKIHDSELGMFALAVMGRRASNYTGDFVNFGGKWLSTKKLVGEALEQIYALFGLDFRQDGDLIAGLKMHIHGLVERVRNQIQMEDVFVEEIKRKYPLVFEMGICVLEFLEERLETSISDAESCYIALHLGAASERMNAERKYRAVMILPHNQSFSEMCVKKISDMFRERMEVVKVFGYFEEEAVSSLDPDLLLSTFPLEHRLNVETVSINLFVDSETESRILQAINRLDKKGFRLEFSPISQPDPPGALSYRGKLHQPGGSHPHAVLRFGTGRGCRAGIYRCGIKERADVSHLLCKYICHSPCLWVFCHEFHHCGGAA